MHKPLSEHGVNENDLECLNSWPENTEGYKAEDALIALLNMCCKEHGYGRVPQIANAIEDIWRNPENIVKYQKIRQDRLQMLKSFEDIDEKENE